MNKADEDRLAREAAIKYATRGGDFSIRDREAANARSDQSKKDQAQQAFEARKRFGIRKRRERGEDQLMP